MSKPSPGNSRKVWLGTLTFIVIALAVLAPGILVSAKRSSSNPALTPSQRQLPNTFDVRGPDGVPRGTSLHQPTAAQLKAIASLQALSGTGVQVRYNGLTGTPSHLFSLSGYLSAPSSDTPETIARNFLNQWKGIFRFSQADLNNLRLKSRATVPDLGVTILSFEQQAAGLPVYHGDVLVNVNRAGRVIDVGSESYPQLQLTPGFTLSSAQAIAAAANSLGINFSPQAQGTKQVLNSFGDLTPTYETGDLFTGDGVAVTGEIVVTKVAFPMGDAARPAYKLALTTAQLEGVTWMNIVDAQSGQVLRRESLTAFRGKENAKQQPGASGSDANLGPPGGGTGPGRLPTFRPDVQDLVEALNSAGTAQGKVFDAVPTSMSGPAGAGRPAAPGTPPTYQSEATLTNPFRLSLVNGRNMHPLVYALPIGQVTRGLADAFHPSNESPFGWFYLPTGVGGTEITLPDANRATTRAYGYQMAAEAKSRNDHTNSPNGDGDQPFSATLTMLSSPKALKDGRTLSQVFQSNYTEGNNVNVSDDHANDNETTQGVRGFSSSRQFTSSLFTYKDSYEFGGADATSQDPNTAGPCAPLGPCVVTFPASTLPDIYPGAVNLFYFNNLIHDYLYGIGFTEPLWNFQQDNFGNGGAGSDGISANLQDGSGTDNSNFSTSDDGSYPRMQMYIFTDGSFRRSDGSLDFAVVAHEHYHGVSTRSVGKGASGCLGLGLVGEPSGQGEGWSDYNAISLTDNDAVGEYVTGDFARAIRRLPYTNYRWSYGSVNGGSLNRRDQGTADVVVGGIPFEAHDTGELWAATLWDMRELLIMKDSHGLFFDGARRLGSGTKYFIGYHQVQSVDASHPIDYRASFNDSNGTTATINASAHIVRPGLIAAEISTVGNRHGPLATALVNGARLSDLLVLRGMQLEPCNPSFVDSRDGILLADRELNGGENQAMIWRAFASHGVGLNATSTTSNDPSGTNGEVVVEDFTVPAGVTQCESLGPLAQPIFILSNTQPNTVTVTVNGGIPIVGAAQYVISRGSSPTGPFNNIATIPATQTTYNDNNGGQGLSANQTFYYQVRASRTTDSSCTSSASTSSITVTVGAVITPAPVFTGVDQVSDPQQGNRLIVSWQPAVSANGAADIVYDVYRTTEINPDTTQDPTFTPAAGNRIAQGLKTLSFTDTPLTLNQVYYYIVQARDQNNGKLDTNNAGNTVAKFNAPSITTFTNTPPFGLENFESTSADTRFVPPLVEQATPNISVANFQRVPGVHVGNTTSAMMYAPDFDPGGSGQGAQSNFAVAIGPLTLAPASVMEFDHFFSTENTFDGGVLEISSDPGFGGNNATPSPNNTNTFDLGNYIVDGGYNGKLNGQVASGVMSSILQGRRAYTGAQPELQHVRIPLEDFAPGGQKNAQSLPMYIRFRMTSDVGTNAGPTSGWYVDNVIVHDMGSAATPTPTPTPSPSPSPSASPTPSPSPSASPTPSPSPTPSASPTPSPSPSPSPSASPTATPTPTPVAVFQFNSTVYAIQEAVTALNVTVIRSGDTSGTSTVDVTSADGTAKQKGDYTFVIAHLVFNPGDTTKTFQTLISDDSYTENTEAATLLLQNPVNGTLGAPNSATLQILDNTPETTGNPIDISRTFVGQHYHDFLYRQSDQSGEDFWTNQIEQCGADAQCRQANRVAVSGAFFLSIEFKQTGYLVIRAHKAGFGNGKGTPRYPVFLRDQREITNGLIVGQGNWQAQLDANKQAFLQDFVSRSEFTSQAPFAPGVAASTYVDALFANSSVTPTSSERSAAISAYGSGDTAGRAAALKSVIESGSVFNKLYNDSFVLMQYFGYLRRNPDDAPDNNFSGYDFWLAKLNSVSQAGEDMRDDTQAQHRTEKAEMIRAFIESNEYRQRFGGSPSGNQFAPPDDGQVGRFLKGIVRFAFFGDAG